jgi:hypothetical protein
VLNISRTFFVSFVLLGGSLLFGRDIYSLVINPIERMIQKVQEVVENPQKVKETAFIEAEEEEFKLLQKKPKDEEEDEQDLNVLNQEDNQLETSQIEQAIKKIGILMGVGLGDAGTSLIQ